VKKPKPHIVRWCPGCSLQRVDDDPTLLKVFRQCLNCCTLSNDEPFELTHLLRLTMLPASKFKLPDDGGSGWLAYHFVLYNPHVHPIQKWTQRGWFNPLTKEVAPDGKRPPKEPRAARNR
jgi:hypothetical protein